MNEADVVYPCGLRVGDRVVLRRLNPDDDGRYNAHVVRYLRDGTSGVVLAPPNDGFPDDAVQVEMDGGYGAVEAGLLRRAGP